MRHTYSCPIRWADMDAFGHVNNVVWSDYLQEARADMLRLHALPVHSPAAGQMLEGTLVVSQQLRYAAPLSFDARPVTVEVWADEVRAASFTLAYEVFREDAGGRTVYLRASTVLAPYVFAQGSPRRLTAEERAGLAPYVEEAAPKWTAPVAFSEPRRHELGHAPVHVRFSDVDVYGHANNVIYLEYFQESRITVMARQIAEIAPDGSAASFPPIVVAQQDVDYRRPMLMRQASYDSWTWVSRLGRTSMILESEIRDGGAEGELMARGRFVLVFVDHATGTPIPPPEALAHVLKESM